MYVIQLNYLVIVLLLTVNGYAYTNHSVSMFNYFTLDGAADQTYPMTSQPAGCVLLCMRAGIDVSVYDDGLQMCECYIMSIPHSNVVDGTSLYLTGLCISYYI